MGVMQQENNPDITGANINAMDVDVDCPTTPRASANYNTQWPPLLIPETAKQTVPNVFTQYRNDLAGATQRCDFMRMLAAILRTILLC
jgi:hypothetical protein